jgi:hypothetical protein
LLSVDRVQGPPGPGAGVSQTPRAIITESYRSGVKTGQSNRAAWTGDKNGWEFLHEEAEFATLFSAVNLKLRAYLDMLSVNADRVTLHYTRSWGTVSERNQSIRRTGITSPISRWSITP